jgi:hypothetical protein
MIRSKQRYKSLDTVPLRHELHEIFEQGAIGSRVGVFVGRSSLSSILFRSQWNRSPARSTGRSS